MCMMSGAKLKKMRVDNNSLKENFYHNDLISGLPLKSKSINLRFKNISHLDLQKQHETL